MSEALFTSKGLETVRVPGGGLVSVAVSPLPGICVWSWLSSQKEGVVAGVYLIEGQPSPAAN